MKRYGEGTGLSKRIARMNPRWCDPKTDKAGEDAKFELASSMTGQELTEQLDMLVNSWLAARDYVRRHAAAAAATATATVAVAAVAVAAAAALLPRRLAARPTPPPRCSARWRRPSRCGSKLTRLAR